MGASGAGGAQQSNPLMNFLPLIAIIAIMYFLLLRPQAKKQKEHRALLEALEKGDKIISTGGLVGTIAGIKEKESTILVKIAENVKVEMSRAAVAQVIKKKAE
ncbi:preprotein translocase subunit YajC [candidate division KSB1 bacterium]|nr:preprotein translocase subunit YajC [candidate division KSB1 bacterium]